MGFFADLFGLNKPVEQVIAPAMPEVAPEPPKSEAEQALDQFERELNAKSGSLDKARETLYDRKAQLNTMRMAQTDLEGEINAHKQELASVEDQYGKAITLDRADLEIRGQKLQNIILRKEEKLHAERISLRTFEKTIDVLEKNVMGSELQLNQKRTRLESAKTAAAVIELNEDINNNLQLGYSNIDEKGLEVFLERQKLVLEDMDSEVVAVTVGEGVMALPFKERMGADDVIETA